MIDKLGIRVRAIGDLSLIPAKTRQTIDKVVEYPRFPLYLSVLKLPIPLFNLIHI